MSEITGYYKLYAPGVTSDLTIQAFFDRSKNAYDPTRFEGSLNDVPILVDCHPSCEG